MMHKITNYWGHANQDYNEGSPPGGQSGHQQTILQTITASVGGEKGTLLSC